MIYKLKISTQAGSEPQEFALNREKTLLGRRKENHIRLQERFVSSYHAVIFFGSDNELFLEDCGSRNGIYLNGNRVEEICELKTGDRISIGELRGEIVAEKPVEMTSHHERECLVNTDLMVNKEEGSHLSQLQSEIERLANLKAELEAETEQLAKDHNDLHEDLNDAKKKIENLIDLECELQESVGTLQVSTVSRKKVYPARDEQTCATTERRICRELIGWLESLEEAQKEAQPNLLMNRTTRKLSGLEGDFVELLAQHSVKKIEFAPGAEISMQSRSKVQLVAIHDIEDAKLRKDVANTHSRLGDDVVLRTISPGFVYESGGKEHVLRKAEVVVA